MSTPGEESSHSRSYAAVAAAGPAPPSPSSSIARSYSSSVPRATSTARLASPVPTNIAGSPSARRSASSSQYNAALPSGSLTPLPGQTAQSPVPGPGVSALAAALSNSYAASPPRHGTPARSSNSPRSGSPAPGAAGSSSNQLLAGPSTNYGSFDRARSIKGELGWSGPGTFEDPEVVRRHLVQPSTDRLNDRASSDGRSASPAPVDASQAIDDDEFSSLQLQGGDITRPIYKWSADAQARAEGRGRTQRSKSFNLGRPEAEDDTLDIGAIKVPGGFRRNFIQRTVGAPVQDGGEEAQRPRFLANNFIEYLSLFGHYAGEELEEDDEILQPNEYFGSDDSYVVDSDDEREPMEDSALLTPSRRRRRRKERGGSGTNTPFGAALMLLKSFVGTGVLFLPRAYLSGGMTFSNLVLLFIALLSYYCFVLLINTRLKVSGSFGDIGGIVYGPWMRIVILWSIVISQIGFVAAYILFTSENLQAFILAVSNCEVHIEIKWLILMQMAVFLPFSLLRDISKLGATALVADALILLGLIYLYYYDIFTIVNQGGFADIIQFNPKDWTLFIGTAIFTFEGIGLIIPIQESMRDQRKFPMVMGIVMIVITVVFVSMGALSYAAYGSATETVVILNLPQGSKLVNAIQFMYSLAILLSTPLQIFPAIRIMENGLFTKSGKYNPYIKWQKNVFRFFVVLLCGAISWGGSDNLEHLVSLIGNFACIPLVYIYPPMLHYRAVSRTTFRRGADIALCIFGLVAMVYTTSLTVQSWASGPSGPPTPRYCDGGKKSF